MILEGTALGQPHTNTMERSPHPTSFPSHFQQCHDPKGLAILTAHIANWHPGAVQQENFCSSPHSYHCHPWLSLEWGQGPAAGAGLGATGTGSLPGSSDLGPTSPGMRPFANAQLWFLLLFSKTRTETSPCLSGFIKGYFSSNKDQEDASAAPSTTGVGREP